jgi:hypothetical protein
MANSRTRTVYRKVDVEYTNFTRGTYSVYLKRFTSLLVVTAVFYFKNILNYSKMATVTPLFPF